MCGIAAVFGPAPQRALVPRLSTLLSHRGPDDAGIVDLLDPGGRVVGALAHRRLAVIDVSTRARQPMSRVPEGNIIAYNGEIYNFRELRGDLVADGSRFATESDTEVLLAGWAAEGPRILPRLRGMFAFMLWEPRTASAYLARDRFGIKPLYVYERPGLVAVASEVRALVASGMAPCRITRSGVATYLATGSTGEPDTLVDGIRIVPAGTWIRIRLTASGPIVDAPVPFATFPSLSAESAREASPPSAARLVRDALRDAVAAHLVSDVEVGVLLSGGIDSAAVLTLAADVAGRPLRTFTVGFDQAAFTEVEDARAIADRAGAVHETVRLSDAEMLQSLDAGFGAMDLPSIDGHNVYYVTEAIRRRGIKVALSGLGGDELFCGYPSFRRARLSAPLWRGRVGGSARRLVGAVARRGHRGRAEKAALWLQAATPALGAYTGSRALFGPRALVALGGFEHGYAAPAPRGLSTRAEVSWYELTGYMRNTLLRDADVFSMANGLELRVPLVDWRVADAVAAVDDQLVWNGAAAKPLLRLALGDRLPADIWDRPKRGFTLPFAVWLRGILRPNVEAELRGSAAERCGIAPLAAQQVWERFLGGSESWSRPWALYTLLRWARERNAELSEGGELA